MIINTQDMENLAAYYGAKKIISVRTSMFEIVVTAKYRIFKRRYYWNEKVFSQLIQQMRITAPNKIKLHRIK